MSRRERERAGTTRGKCSSFRGKVSQDGVELPDVEDFSLMDDGAGADLVANDGLYSNYFIPPNQKNGDYKFRCKIEGFDGNATAEAAVTEVIEELAHSDSEVFQLRKVLFELRR